MGDMGTVLNDVANTANNLTLAKNEEAHTLAREKGWAEPQEFDYNAYNASGKAAGAVELVKDDWAHNAEKYEWKEEYGEVGPQSQALEDQLFRSDFINRRGVKFDE